MGSGKWMYFVLAGTRADLFGGVMFWRESGVWALASGCATSLLEPGCDSCIRDCQAESLLVCVRNGLVFQSCLPRLWICFRHLSRDRSECVNAMQRDFPSEVPTGVLEQTHLLGPGRWGTMPEGADPRKLLVELLPCKSFV